MAHDPKYASSMDELVSRVRRIETRLTTYMVEQGFDTQTAQAYLGSRALVVPNINVALKEILAAIPAGYRGDEIPLELGGKIVAYIRPAD